MINYEVQALNFDGVTKYPLTIQICGPGELDRYEVLKTVGTLLAVPGLPYEALLRVLVPLAFRLLVMAARL